MTAIRSLLVITLVASCEPPVTEPPLPDTSPPVGDYQHVMTMTPNLDLLFVIDDSGSMADKQNAFNRAFPALLAELAKADGGLPNLHLGVTSTDLGTSVSGSGTPGPGIGTVGQGGCAGFGKAGKLTVGTATVTGNFLRSTRSGQKNFTGTIEATFDAMAKLGSAGCGFEQQLGAMRKALDNNEANAGFVRASANLGVIVLSDEDDCSAASTTLYGPESPELGKLDSFRCFRHGVECAEDVTTIGAKTQCRPRANSTHVQDIAPFRDFLLALKSGEARRVMFGAIIGDATPVAVETRLINGQNATALARSCTYMTPTATAVADPGVRFAALASSFPGPAKAVSICSADLTPQATELGSSLRALVNDPCLPSPILADADCIVTDFRDSDQTYRREFTACTTGGTDCYRIVDDAARCPTSKQRIELVRETTFDTWSTLRCRPPRL